MTDFGLFKWRNTTQAIRFDVDPFVDVSVAGGIVIVVAHVHNFMQSVFQIMQATCYPHFCGTAVKFNKRRYDALK